MAPKSNKAVGDELEQRVALYYEAMGYQVSRDVLIAGHQIDLVATRYIPGAGEVRLLIEAKSRAAVLGVNDVTTFINAARHIFNTGGAMQAVLITNAKISREARLAVEAQPFMKVLTLGELEHHLFNNAESLLRVVKDYETKPIFEAYYELAANGDGGTRDVANEIKRWASGSTGLLMLIGDFGSGKSTIMDRVFYDSAKLRMTTSDVLFPVLLRLRGLRQHVDLWQFIAASLRDLQYITPPKSVFEYELSQGRLLLLLDGFDEIYSGATAKDRGKYIDFLRPLLKSRSPVVLSSRPTFFDSFNDLLASARRLTAKEDVIERLPDFGLDRTKIAKAFGADVTKALRRNDFARVLEIRQLDKSQIRRAIAKQEAVIKHTLGMSVETFEAHLYDIYDLEDLMSRPLLLDMILQTIATGAIDIKSAKTVGASTLYDLYTQQAAFRDKNRSADDQLLTPELRLEACRALARAMLRKGNIVLTEKEVEDAVTETLRADPDGRKAMAQVDISGVITDIRTCSFLGFTEEGTLNFKHKSFYEFFIAQDMYLASMKGGTAFLSYPRDRINREIVYFLASFIRDQENFATFVKTRIREKLDEDDRSFLYSLAFASGEVLEKSSLTGGTIAGVELAKATIKSAYALSVTIAETTIRRVTCDSWKFNDVALKGCQVLDATLSSSELAVSSISSSFDRCLLDKSTLSIGGKDVSFADTEFTMCRIDFNCAVVLSGSKMINCDRIMLGNNAQLHIKQSQFLNSALTSMSEGLWYSPGARAELRDCILNGLVLSGNDVHTNLELRAKRRIDLHNCAGVIFLAMTTDMETKVGIPLELLERNPNLLIINQRVVAQIRSYLRAHKAALAKARDGQAKQEVEASGSLDADDAIPLSTDDLRPAVRIVHDQLQRFLDEGRITNAMIPDLLKDLMRAAGRQD